MTMGEVFIHKKSCKTDKNIVKSPTFTHPFTFSKAFHWATLESSSGRFCPSGLMFDTSVLESTFSANSAAPVFRPPARLMSTFKKNNLNSNFVTKTVLISYITHIDIRS